MPVISKKTLDAKPKARVTTAKMLSREAGALVAVMGLVLIRGSGVFAASYQTLSNSA
jgi:hypothetical protein